MVTRKNVSKWSGAEVPSEEELASAGGRLIAKDQLYAAAEVRKILQTAPTPILYFTQKCQRDVSDRLWDEKFVAGLLEDALSIGKRAKPEWCVQAPTGPVAACDVYIVRRRERHPSKDAEIVMEYYVKFAISLNGNIILLTSCHPTIK